MDEAPYDRHAKLDLSGGPDSELLTACEHGQSNDAKMVPPNPCLPFFNDMHHYQAYHYIYRSILVTHLFATM